MPIIKLETNARIPAEKNQPLARALRGAMGRLTGEHEDEFQVELAGDRRMKMAESDEPIAHIEIRGIDYPKDRAKFMADILSHVVDEHLSIQENRIYIAVVSNRMSMWRVNAGADNS